jgi:hypothetical protein
VIKRLYHKTFSRLPLQRSRVGTFEVAADALLPSLSGDRLKLGKGNRCRAWGVGHKKMNFLANKGFTKLKDTGLEAEG